LYAYVNGNPVNGIDPTGEFLQYIKPLLEVYAGLEAIDFAAEKYYQYQIFNMLDEQERYLRKLLEETKPEECEKFNFLKEEIEKIVQRKAMLGLAAGKDLLSKTYKSAPNKNKIIPSGVQ
jgi:hypothetical protein